MKKILPLIIVLLTIGFVSNAQLTIEFEGMDITNDTVYFDSLALDADINHHFDVENHYSGAGDTICNYSRYDVCAPSAVSNLICFGVHCYPPNNTSNDEVMPLGESLDFHLHMVLGGNTTGFVTRYNFYIDGHPEDSVWFYVINDPAGDCSTSANSLAKLENNISVYPNPANDNVVFDYDIQNTKGSLFIRNIIGKQIKAIELNNSIGRLNINTSDLPSGTYFCTINSEFGISKTIKLIVSH